MQEPSDKYFASLTTTAHDNDLLLILESADNLNNTLLGILNNA